MEILHTGLLFRLFRRFEQSVRGKKNNIQKWYKQMCIEERTREQPSKEVVKSSRTYSTGSRVIGNEDGILPNCHRPSLLNYMVWVLPVGSYQKL